MNRISKLILIVLLNLGLVPLLLAQDSSQTQQETTNPETGDGPDTANAADGTQAIVDESEELILAETEEEEESPDRFIPTEEISQDLGVSFPVDI